MMKISFIIPVYNCYEYLDSLVQNIEIINWTDYEIILIDDGSSDGSYEKLCELKSQNEMIKAFHHPNKGVSYTRNRGIHIAEGEYVIFLDADDSFNGDMLYDCLLQLEQNDSVDMAVWGITFDYYHKGKCYRSDQLIPEIEGLQSCDSWLRNLSSMFRTNMLSPVWNKAIRRQVLIDNEIYFNTDLFLYEDLDFSLRCISCCNNILFQQKPLYHYRQPEDEGNAGRRLMRISDLSILVEQIDQSFAYLKEKKRVEIDTDGILLDLYLCMARLKISVCPLKEISKICKNFSIWCRNNSLSEESKKTTLGNRMLEKNILMLVIHRTYSKMRHKLAIRVKTMLCV